jgi:YggT family protein
MVAIVNFLFAVISALMTVVIWIIIANAIMSMLIAFDVINMRNRVVRQIVTFLDAMTRPILRPLRRVIPVFGGIDITSLILIIVLGAAQQYLLPALQEWVISLIA